MAKKRVNADLEVVGEVTAAGENLNAKLALLDNLLPEPPLPLNGLEFEAGQVNGGAQMANLALDAGAAYEYGLAAGNLNVPNVIRDSAARLLTVNSDRFDRADEGQMKLFLNGTLRESLDLTQTGDAGGHLREAGHALERIEIVAHNGFAPYPRGRMRIYLGVNGCVLRSGANRIRLEHEIGGALHGSGELTLFYDAGSNAPSLSMDPLQSLVSANDPGAPVYLSGVRYFPAGAPLHLKVTAQKVFETAFPAAPLTLRGEQAGFVNQDISYVPGGNGELSGYSLPPESDEPFIVEKDVVLESGYFTRDARVSAVIRDPFEASAPVFIPNQDGKTILVNSSPQQSTELLEKFTDEHYRLPAGAYDSLPNPISGQWNSANGLPSGAAEVGGGLRYPQNNYSQGFIPSSGQPDYSGRSGEVTYYRAFRDLNDPHNSGILKLTGLTLSDIQAEGQVKVEIKLPGRTGWLDVGKPFDAGSFAGADGDGCRTAASGDEFSWTAGVNSTALSGWMIVVRVTLKSAAAPLVTEMRLLGW